MQTLVQTFGEGKDLNSLQMSRRGVVVSMIALVLIRISGRRSFGLHTTSDNICAHASPAGVAYRT